MREKLEAEKREREREKEKARVEAEREREREAQLAREAEELEARRRLEEERAAEELRRQREEQERGKRLQKVESAKRQAEREEAGRRARAQAEAPVSPPRHGRFGLFGRRRDNSGASQSPPQTAKPSVGVSSSVENRDMDTIRPGGGGAVLGIDAPISAVNAGDRVRCSFHPFTHPLSIYSFSNRPSN